MKSVPESMVGVAVVVGTFEVNEVDESLLLVDEPIVVADEEDEESVPMLEEDVPTIDEIWDSAAELLVSKKAALFSASDS